MKILVWEVRTSKGFIDGVIEEIRNRKNTTINNIKNGSVTGHCFNLK